MDFNDTDNDIQGEEMSNTIPRYNVAALRGVIDKANRRLERAQVEERFVLEVSEPRMIQKADAPGVWIEVVDVVLNKPVISADGYAFVAAIVKEENGFVVRSAKGVELEGWRPDVMLCEHCGRRRNRNKTYLVVTPEGERIQVGSSCIKPLLGMSPAGLWAVIFDIDFSSYTDEGGFSTPREDMHTPLKYVIAMALGVSSMGEDFITQSAVNNGYNGESTSSIVKEALFGVSSARAAERAKQAEAAYRILNTEAALVDEIIESAQVPSPSTDYETNMNVIMSGEWVVYRNLGYAVSAVGSWVRNKRIETEKKEKAANAVKGYIAEVGEKLKNLHVTVTDISDFPTTDYLGYPSTTTRVTFKDNAGKVLIWWSTSASVNDLEEGCDVVITSGSVKKHDVFNETDQTVATRVRFKVKS